MILFINACVREGSRTKKLADHLLSKWNGPVEEIRLDIIDFPVTDEAFLSKRDKMIREQKFDDPLFRMADLFASADRIVIAAPYWDLSFPASLKQFIEHINVTGITFRYTAEGVPEGLCKADRLYYVATAGGMYVPEEFGFGYIKTLAESFYGIPDVRLITAKGLDIDGADTERIMNDALRAIDETEP